MGVLDPTDDTVEFMDVMSHTDDTVKFGTCLDVMDPTDDTVEFDTSLDIMDPTDDTVDTFAKHEHNSMADKKLCARHSTII